mmetsp:Transcript_23221/g.50295  ORF Transcript_23221/g.50295 Transcript_23221/m.50295 type:complete len:226 (+) Transcript_23221:94-771(+)
MKLFPLLAAIVLSTREGTVSGFSISSSSTRSVSSRTKLHANTPNNRHDEPSNSKNIMMQRRSLLSSLLAASSTLFLLPTITNAETLSISSDEFDVILKDSAKSILTVELSGPKSETAIVKLVDGTTFTISDLVESSVDPRSPLKLVARCRLYKIPVRNTGMVSAVTGEGNIISSSGKKKKNFANPRVQKAEALNVKKRERMAEDERERLEELYKMEGAEKGFLSE